MAEQRKLADRRSRFILLVDSDTQNLSYLSALLQRLDYQTYTVTTARDAIDALITAVPSLIITSLALKEMDSLRCMQPITKRHEIGTVPFIAIIKEDNLAEETRSFFHRAADCLSHPIFVERLYRAVQTIIETTPRTYIRLRTLLPVKITGMQHRGPCRMCALDLSEHGVFLSSDEPLAVNTQLSLLINLNGRLVPVEARVLHNNRIGEGSNDESGMGLEFTHIEPGDQETIWRFIQNEITQGIAVKKVSLS